MYNATVHNAIVIKSSEAEFMNIPFLIDYSILIRTKLSTKFYIFYIPFINCLAVPHMYVCPIHPAHTESSLTVMDISMEV